MNIYSWSTHVPSLYYTCKGTKGRVLEIGGGVASTPLLQALLCFADPPRELVTLEADEKFLFYINKLCTATKHHQVFHTVDYLKTLEKMVQPDTFEVAFIDSGSIKDEPRGFEERKEMGYFLRDKVPVLIFHDIEFDYFGKDEKFVKWINTFEHIYIDQSSQPFTATVSDTVDVLDFWS